MRNSLKYKLFWLGFFAIWMGYLEAAVVIYLREIYFPEGFSFPMKYMPFNMALTELGREAATIFMLLGISFVSSKKAWTRFACFMICFGAWDIWYYIWLKIILNWPTSLLTWDILFLIPVPWVAPVLAPVIVSISLIITGVIILYFENNIGLLKYEWVIVIAAGLIIFVSFILETPTVIKLGVPTHYYWILLIIGEVLGFFILFKALTRIRTLKTADIKTHE